MQQILFENFNSALSDFPYIVCNTENINYLSHFHEEIEIIVVIDGSVNIVCENNALTANCGDICVFMPGEIHSFATVSSNRLYITKINSKNSVEKIDFSQLRLENCLIHSGTEFNQRIRSLLDTAVYEYKSKKTGYAYRMNSIANEIVCDILRSDFIYKITFAEKKRNLFFNSLLESVSAYIEQHYSEQISLEDIAKHCNYSKYYFAHSFKSASNMSFYDFLTAYKLEKSVSLLSYTDEKITDIAYFCGFANPRAFNRAFKKMFRQTPMEYRKNTPNEN